MPYEPTAQAQFVPKTLSSKDDCVAADAAAAIDRSTVGAVVVDHAAIRAASGQPAGGLSYPTAIAAALKVSTAHGRPVLGEFRANVTALGTKALLQGGHSATISIDTSVTHGTSCGTNEFIGDHSLYIAYYNPSRDAFWLDDPGTTLEGFHYCPADLIIKAAMLRDGYRGINLIVWPDTEGVSRTAVASTPYYDKPFRSSTVKGKLVKGKRYTVTSTFNGGGWPNLTGGTSFGWYRLPGDVYVPGKDLR